MAAVPDGIRRGVSIAAGSLKAMTHDRQLLVFSFLSGLVLSFLVEAEAYNAGHFHYVLPFLITLSMGNPVVVFDPLIFLVEMICLFCFTLVLAGLVLHGTATEHIHRSRSVSDSPGFSPSPVRLQPCPLH